MARILKLQRLVPDDSDFIAMTVSSTSSAMNCCNKPVDEAS